MQEETESYIRKNGIEWTCSRYKAIWNAALHLRNGDRESAQKAYQQASIAYHKSDMTPKGPWRFAVQQFTQAQKPSVIRRYGAVLRWYTSLALAEPSKAQIDKFCDAVLTPPKRSQAEFRKIGFEIAKTVCESRKFDQRLSKEQVAKMANPSDLHGTSYYFSGISEEVKHTLKKDERSAYLELLKQPYGKFLQSLLTESWIPSSLKYWLPYDAERERQLLINHLDSGYNGRIVMLQQQGCKGRTVFQPTARLQLAFQPLHEACTRITERLFYPEASWKNQVDGVYAALNHVANGKPCFSVDQSSATDRFPRGISEGILDYLGLGFYADALEEVCSRPWQCSFLPCGEATVATGQPMGLFGSFPLYNLSNLMIAEYAALKVPKWLKADSQFYDCTYYKVVGDDIIFSDEYIAQEYRKLLSDLGVKVSEMKSFSGKVGEFAGFLIIPTNDSATAFRPYKYPMPDVNYISNPLDFLHAIGAKVSSLNGRWKDHFEAYSKTVSQRYLDLSPLVTVDHQLRNPVTKNKDVVVVGTAQAITSALCQAYDSSPFPSQQLASYVDYCFHGVDELILRYPDGSDYASDLVDMVSYATGATPVSDTEPAEFFSRDQYEVHDRMSKKEATIPDQRLKADPLISDFERNQMGIDWSSSMDERMARAKRNAAKVCRTHEPRNRAGDKDDR
jgi:hypothetical protein